jgi:hypothetical protein
MKPTVKKGKGGSRQKTLKEEKRDITRSLKSFGKKVAGKLKGNSAVQKARRPGEAAITCCSIR